MNKSPKTGRRCFYSLAIIMVMACVPVFTGIASAGVYVWPTHSMATGYKLYYSIDNDVTVDDPSVDAGSDNRYELCHLPLTACTTYYLRPAAYNVSGEIFIDTVYAYPNSLPQVTAGPQAASVFYDSATIQWTTDVSATGSVDYGTTASYGSIESSTVYTNNHSILLTGLTSNTTYHFMASSYDPDGCRPGCDASTNSPPGDHVFTTQPAPDLDPPVINAGPTVTSLSATTATIEWTTDEESTSSVYFDSDGSGEPYTFYQGDPDFVTVHNLTINGLATGTTYYLRVGSTDALGNGPTFSTEITFTTDAVPAPPRTLRIIN